MKTLSEICILGKEEYVNRTTKDNQKYLGMCIAMHKLFMDSILTTKEYEMFTNEYNNSIRGRDVFFNYLGEKTDNRDDFCWTPSNRQARINWFNKRIN